MAKSILVGLVATVLSYSSAMAACGPNCHRKCHETWRPGGFASEELCVAKWSIINARGKAYAHAIEEANRARGWRRE